MNAAEQFCRTLVHEYLENCNYDIFKLYLDENASIIGLGESEFYPSLAEFSALIEREKSIQKIKFKVREEKFWSHPLGNNTHLILAHLFVSEDLHQQAACCEIEFRFSFILHQNNGWKVLHIHQSMPDPSQVSGEFSPRNFVKNANHQLKTIITQQTKELQDMNQRLQYAVEHDYLTGLYNRSYLESVVSSSLQSAFRETSIFVMIDVDNFKKYNDLHGHFVGDQVLRAIGQWMLREFPDGVSARFGGDEFAMYFYGLHTTPEAFQSRVNAASRSLHDDPLLEQYYVTVSIGGAFYESEQSLEALYQCADKALYQAKKSGKSSCVLYRHEIS